MLSSFVFAALALAQDGSDIRTPPAAHQEYLSCVRDRSEVDLPRRDVRYADELFRASVQHCIDTAPSEPVDDPATTGVERTRLFIETLVLLNSLPRPRAQETQEALIAIVPAGRTARARDELDRTMSEDFSVLYWPWVGCLAAVLRTEQMDAPALAIAGAQAKCEKVSATADGEAMRLLEHSAAYGDGEHQRVVLDEFKKTMSQLALLGFLRSNGEALGPALEQSERAVR